MTTSAHVGDRAAAPLEADLTRAVQLEAELQSRLRELSNDPGNAEGRELGELQPKLAAHVAELRNSIAVVKLVRRQIELQDYVRIDGNAPLMTRILGFVAMADERTRQETMATFTARGDRPYTIEDAVMRLYRRGLVKRTRRGVVEAVHAKAWAAIKEEMTRAASSLTQRILSMIRAEGPCGRRDILERFAGKGIASGAVDSSLQRLRVQRKVSSLHTGRTTTYAIAGTSGEPAAEAANATSEECVER